MYLDNANNDMGRRCGECNILQLVRKIHKCHKNGNQKWRRSMLWHLKIAINEIICKPVDWVRDDYDRQIWRKSVITIVYAMEKLYIDVFEQSNFIMSATIAMSIMLLKGRANENFRKLQIRGHYPCTICLGARHIVQRLRLPIEMNGNPA